MKLSKETLAVFKNFASINSNLSIKAGKTLVTMSTGKNIIAKADVAEEFPIDFGIYDLNEFLGTLSLFESPELDFTDKSVTIKEGKNSVKYFAANSQVLTVVPTLKAFPEPDIQFNLSQQMLGQIQRVASILKVADFSISGDGSVISISIGDKKNPTGTTFDSELGTTDKTFKVNLKVENLRMLATDYTVAIGGKKIARFLSTNNQLTYFVAIELDSTFDF
jgi:hypothetical protein